jgi:hypothetical protein
MKYWLVTFAVVWAAFLIGFAVLDHALTATTTVRAGIYAALVTTGSAIGVRLRTRH